MEMGRMRGNRAPCHVVVVVRQLPGVVVVIRVATLVVVEMVVVSKTGMGSLAKQARCLQIETLQETSPDFRF
jgi:hypothetical protein